jgi:hypothetical protein
MNYRNKRGWTTETGKYDLQKQVRLHHINMYVRTTDISMHKQQEMGTYELQKYVIWTTELGVHELQKQACVTSADLSRI